MGDFVDIGNTTSDGEVVIFEHRKCAAQKSSRLLDVFQPLVQYAEEKNSPISCLYLMKEKEVHAENVYITVLRFASEVQYDQYMKSSARSFLQETCIAEGLLLEPLHLQRLTAVAGFPYRTSGPDFAPGIHVAMAKITYAPETRNVGIEHWRKVASSVEKTEVEGTYTYWFLADPDDENILYSLERYRDESYLWDVHVPSAAIQDNTKNQRAIRTGLVLRGFESMEGTVQEPSAIAACNVLEP